MAGTGAEIARAFVTLTVQAPGIKRDVESELGKVDGDKAGRQIGKELDAGAAKGFALGGAVAGAVSALVSKGIDSLKSLVGEAITASDATDKFKSTLDFAGIDSKGVKALAKSTREYADATVYDLNDIQSMTAQLASNGVKDFAKLGEAAGNLNAVAGGNADTFKSVGMVMTQTAGQGKLVTENWNQLSDAIPGAAGPLQEALKKAGAYTGNFRDAMSKGQITADEFNKAVMNLGMTDAAKEAATSTETMEGAFGNLEATIVGGLSDGITAIKPMLTDLINATSEGIAVGIDWVKNNLPLLKEMALWVGKLVAAWLAFKAVQGVVMGVRKAIALYNTVTGIARAATIGWRTATAAAAVQQRLLAGATTGQTVAAKAAAVAQKALNVVMKANPIGLIITAVTALVAALVWFFTKTELGKKIWAGFMDFLSDAWSWIKDTAVAVWTGIGDWFAGFWDGVKQVFWAAVDWVKKIFWDWSPLGMIVNNWGAITQWFADFWEGVKGFFRAAVDWVADLFFNWTPLGLIISNWSVISQWFSNFWTGVKGFFRSAVDWVVQMFLNWTPLGQIIKNWGPITGFFKNLWSGIKSVFSTFLDYVKTKPVQIFKATVDAIGKAWRGIQELAKKPVRFVIDTVVNGLIRTINKIPGVNLKEISLPKGFSEGGWTGPGGKYTPAGVVHADEFVVSKAARRRFEKSNPGALDYLNRTGTLPGYARGGFVNPLPGYTMTTQFMGYPGHAAVDLAKPLGSPVQAAAAGTVKFAGWNNQGLGNMADIVHAGGFMTRYGHMLAPLSVRTGQTVKAGQIVGHEGSTGNSTGPHLHFEVWKDGVRVDPTPYLAGAKSMKGTSAGILDGLMGWATKKLKSAFPEGGMWIDAAGGLMKQAVKGMTSWAGHSGSEEPYLYDNGGWLKPGLSMVENRSGRPEPILTASQWDDLLASRSGGVSGPVVVRIGDREFEGWIGELADERIDNQLDQAARMDRLVGV